MSGRFRVYRGGLPLSSVSWWAWGDRLVEKHRLPLLSLYGSRLLAGPAKAVAAFPSSLKLRST